MKALISELAAKADLDEGKAEQVANVVKGFLEDRLPDAIKGPVMQALNGENISSAADAVKGALGGLLGGD
ncbi:MAG: hypothetical protein AAF928_20385 [Myxococcota bacterium]